MICALAHPPAEIDVSVNTESIAYALNFDLCNGATSNLHTHIEDDATFITSSHELRAPCRARGRDGSRGSPCSHPRLLPHRGGHSESPIVFIFRVSEHLRKHENRHSDTYQSTDVFIMSE